MGAHPEASSARDGDKQFSGVVIMPAPSEEVQYSPHESFPYEEHSASPVALRQRPTELKPPRSRCAAFLRYNAVQRILSAAVLAPAVTIFLWLSPAIATTTVCSFMTSTCSYEYAWLSNRIRLRILPRLEALERSVGGVPRRPSSSEEVSHVDTHSNSGSDSLTSSRTFDFDVTGSRSMSHLHQRASLTQDHARSTRTRAFQEEQEAQEIARVDGELRDQEARLKRCAVTEVALYVFGGHEKLAAVCISALICTISSAVLLVLMEWLPLLQTTEFYESRWFYTIASGFVAALCSCLAPDWQYATVIFLQNAIFTLLTLYSTACPINEFTCSMALHPSHVFLSGMVMLLVFRFATARNGPEAFITFMLDVLGLLYITGSLSILVAFVDDDRRTLYRKLLIALLYIVWASDTGAYLTGKALAYAQYPHYNPLAAHLSKNKDYEGTLGAIAFGIVTMAIASEVLDIPGSFGVKVGFTVSAVVVGRLGDLFESLLKRAAGVKDSGTLIPGHGGVLDRIDALMFATLIFSRYYTLIYDDDGDATTDMTET
ncbi:hypothetical protein BBJ28_00008975 [Nothophytophthora sp. Chile5]|nr:hypothetical protein BBJ28_00008975 [Nothophytophthora sp. Chile5]